MAIRIPFEYQEVEWIESHGTEYINTGLSPSLTHGVKAVYEVSTNGTIFGAITSGGVGYFGIQHNSSNSIVEVYWGKSNSTSQTYTKNQKIDLEFNYKNSKVVTYNGNNFYTLSTSPAITTYPIYVFALNYTNSPSQYFSGKLYSMQITNGTEVVRDYIPCYRKSDGIAGLYCIATDTFFPNQGTGNFTVGAEINHVDRTFQDGVVGSTNVIEGRYIDDSRGQLVNYTMLYDQGEICADVTGGWTAGGSSQNYAYLKGSYIEHVSTGYSGRGYCYTNNKVDITDKVGMAVLYERSGSNNYRVQLRDAWDQSSEGEQLLNTTTNTSKKLVALSIPNSHKGKYVVYVGADTNAKTYFIAVYGTDDWSTLASKAGIAASSIADILAKSSTLLATSDAVNFMCKKCTGDFMASAVSNSTFLTALASSPYKNKVYANEHWAKFLAMVA